MKKLHKILSFVLGIIAGIFGLILFQTIQENQFVRFTWELDTSNLIENIKRQVSGNTVKSSNLSSKGFMGNYDRFEKIYNILQNNYHSGSKISGEKMIQGAMKSFVSAVGDPYTVYLDISEQKSLEEALKGTTDFEGIGAYVAKREQGVLIEEVIKNSPAAKAGIKPLDIIVKVNGESMIPLTIGEAVEKIKGPAGTTVRLFILRTHGDEQKVFEQEVTRGKIEILSVKSKLLTGTNNKKIGYIEISSVGKTTATLFKKELQYLVDMKIKGLILDVRGNGGGFLDVAVEILSYFVPKGKVVVEAKYRNYDNEKYESKGYLLGKYLSKDFPIVVLTDGLTASAGEIITITLDELCNAIVIGTKTFGKGSIQTMKLFNDQSSLKYTIGKRYSPSGRSISGTGYSPDIEIKFNRTGYIDNHIDNQLQRAIIEVSK